VLENQVVRASVADADGLEFEPISRETVSSQIRAQLLRRITTGELRPGARMPSERDLAEQFRVARTSVREAMQGLLSLGVVERRGNRSFVAEHLPEVVVNRPDDRKGFVTQLFETRRVLEVPIFALAAVRADDATRARVSDLADRFHRDLDIADFRRLDREFHTTVASACGNPLLIELYGKVLDELFRSREFEDLLSDEKNRAEVRRIVADSGAAHEAIALAFAVGDIEEMERCTREHVGAVAQAMVDDLV
jgi:GntR family transcriptional repressor for pyruvate dehydrogenase complex